jgi:hypothetical protein
MGDLHPRRTGEPRTGASIASRTCLSYDAAITGKLGLNAVTLDAWSDRPTFQAVAWLTCC